jgi:hypothetical protein
MHMSDLRSSGTLRRAARQFCASASRQAVGLIFTGQEVQEATAEEWTDRSSRKVGTDLPLNAA